MGYGSAGPSERALGVSEGPISGRDGVAPLLLGQVHLSKYIGYKTRRALRIPRKIGTPMRPHPNIRSFVFPYSSCFFCLNSLLPFDFRAFQSGGLPDRKVSIPSNYQMKSRFLKLDSQIGSIAQRQVYTSKPRCFLALDQGILPNVPLGVLQVPLRMSRRVGFALFPR